MVPTFWAPTRLASQAIPGPGWVKLRYEPFSPNRLGPSDHSGLTFQPKVGMLFCARYLPPAKIGVATPTTANTLSWVTRARAWETLSEGSVWSSSWATYLILRPLTPFGTCVSR